MRDAPGLGATEAGFLVGYKSRASGPHWVKRFNSAGLAGLEDKPRAGRPVSHSEEVRSQVIDLALQKPRSLGLPFELWTLTRLATAYEERYGGQLAPSTIWKWLQAEGLDWKRQQSWFQDADQHDPEFVGKRGP
jgi:transposase